MNNVINNISSLKTQVEIARLRRQARREKFRDAIVECFLTFSMFFVAGVIIAEMIIHW